MSAKLVYKKRLRPLLYYPKVLTFHKITPEFSFGSTNYSPRRFNRLLAFLSDKGINLASLEKAVAEKGERSLAVTFDDGYGHLARYLPLLMERFHFRPTIFVITGYIGRANSWDYTYFFRSTPHLDSKQIRELAENGAAIGSHSHRHRDLTACSPAELRAELVDSKKILEDIIGKEVISLSYPFGHFNRRVIEEARSAGYKYAFTMDFPEPTDENMSIGRIPVYGFDSRLAVFQKVFRGPLYKFEKLKSTFTHRLAAGTIMLNKIRARKQPAETDKSL